MKKTRVIAIPIAVLTLFSAVMAVAQTGYFRARSVNPPMPIYPNGAGYVWNPAYFEPTYQAPQPQVLPQTSSSVEATLEKEGKVLIKWQGEPGAVDQVVFSLLDPEKKVIIEQKVDRLPVEARFPLTNKSAYYRVTVMYINGTKNTVTSLL